MFHHSQLIQKTTRKHIHLYGLCGGGLLVIFFVVSAFFISPHAPVRASEEEIVEFPLSAMHSEENPVVIIIEEREKPTLQAEYWFAYDMVRQEMIWQEGSDQVFPLASLVKLITARIAYDVLPESYELTLSPEALRAHGDHGLVVGQRIPRNTAIALLLVLSSNDIAVALEEAIIQETGKSFQDHAVDYRTRLGLETLTVSTSSGLPTQTGEAGGYASGEELIIIVKDLFSVMPEAASDSRKPSLMTRDGLHYPNTNILIPELSQILFSKTGFTNQSGGHVMIVKDFGFHSPVLYGVFGSTFSGRFTDLTLLIQETERLLAGK
jgi:D-alanyl-D-alanine carboxypeptidase